MRSSEPDHVTLLPEQFPILTTEAQGLVARGACLGEPGRAEKQPVKSKDTTLSQIRNKPEIQIHPASLYDPHGGVNW